MLVCSFVLFLAVISYNHDSYYNLSPKDTRMATAPDPRIIVVAGSSGAMDIDSQMIYDKTHYNPVNMGSSAGLGLRFMFASIDSRLHAGDTILYLMEEQVIQQPYYGDGAALLDTLQANPQYIPTGATPHGIVVMVRHLPNWMQEKANALCLRSGLPFCAQPKPLSVLLYSKHNFNIYGDTISTVAGDAHLTTAEVLTNDAGQIGDRGADPQTLSYLAHTIQNLQTRGVHVLVVWPPLAQSVYDANPTRAAARETQVENELGTSILVGTISTFVMPDTEFLDTSSHLTDQGRKEYTAKLLPLLMSRLKKQ